MSANSIIQAHLPGIGYILWPGNPENPPKFINDEDIFSLQPRVFQEPDHEELVFYYERKVNFMRWVLRNATDAGTNRSSDSKEN